MFHNITKFIDTNNRETANIGLVNVAQLVERRHVNPEVVGSNPALVNLSLFI